MGPFYLRIKNEAFIQNVEKILPFRCQNVYFWPKLPKIYILARQKALIHEKFTNCPFKKTHTDACDAIKKLLQNPSQP